MQHILQLSPSDEILVCGHSNESPGAVLSCSTVYYTVQGIRSVDHRCTETVVFLRLIICIKTPCIKRKPKLI